MFFNGRTLPVARVAFCGLAAAGLMLARPAAAQDDGYRVGENRASAPAPAVSPANSAPRRLARVEYVSGNVTWRAYNGAKWGKAGVNRSLEEGAQLWVEEGGRAEVRFDDGSLLRLGSNTVVTLQNVYVDAQGEYTQIRMISGLATLQPRDERSVYEITGPFLTVKTVGPSRVRIGAGDDVEVAVSRGVANVEGPQGKITLNAGDFIAQRSADTAYAVHALPAPDSWERWNEDRDRRLAQEARPVYHAPSYNHTSTSFFLSLGFPIFGGGYHYYRPYYGRDYGRGAYHHRW